MRTAIPNSVTNPTMLAIEITGATYAPPNPTSANALPATLPDSLQKIAAMMSLKATDVLLKLLSMGMPGVNINSTLDSETAKIKIVIVSAIGEKTNELTSPLYGADAYIDKPFEFEKLEKVIDKLFA